MITHFGLDIGVHSVKAVQLFIDKQSTSLVAAGMVKSPPNVLASESEKDFVALAETIKKLKSEANITTNEVAVSVPERQVFTQIFEFPKMSSDELDQAIPWEAENIIPKPLSEVNLDWEVIDDEESQKSGKVKVFLVASPKDLVSKYIKVLKLANLVPVAMETELLAIVRCLRPIIQKKSLIIGNLGASSSDIAVIKNGNLFMTRSLPTAGGAITRSLSSSLGLDLSVAEEYKKSYGLTSQVEGKVGTEIQPILAVVLNEIKKAISFYEEKVQDHLGLLLLTGGTCLMPGLSEYFAKSLGIEVQIADPFSLVGLNDQTQPDLKKNSPLFTVALGLAMKEV